MTTLLEFIEARIQDDQSAAEAAMAGPGWYGNSHSGQWEQDDTNMRGAVHDSLGGPIVFDEGAPNEAQAVHIARFDPARVLRDVQAKRRLLAFADVLADDRYPGDLHVLQLLAAPYADHADYDPSWSPT